VSTFPGVWAGLPEPDRDRTALCFGEEAISYRELGRRVAAAAAVLRPLLAKAPDARLALLCPNGPAFVTHYLAAVTLGGCVMPVDLRLSTEEIGAQLKDAGVGLAAATPEIRERLGALAGRAEHLHDDLTWVTVGEGPGPDADDGALAPEAVRDDQVAELIYTAGTTSRPKGVMRTVANVRAAVANSIRGFGYGPGERIYLVMPLSHSSALNSQLLPVLLVGGTVVLAEAFDPREAVEALKRHRITSLRAVPTMWQMLLTRPDFREGALPDLHTLNNSSAPIQPAQVAGLRERFPDCRILNSYGLTEASTSTILEDAEFRDHPDSVGRPIGGVEMRVAGEDGAPVPAGEVGEILIRGPHVFKGYLGRAEETGRALRDGWLHTGDKGWMDGEGLYYLLGREQEMIQCSGYNVSPQEVERVIEELPQVAEAAVIGIPHRMLGQVVKAVVVPRAGQQVDGRAVTRHCAGRLASHKVPFVVETAPELPRNSLGKLLRNRLK
jgi:acyl-CoA synthetase (AMP-forming)/AMP-acid ligase II